jgi:hypothetical protein
MLTIDRCNALKLRNNCTKSRHDHSHRDENPRDDGHSPDRVLIHGQGKGEVLPFAVSLTKDKQVILLLLAPQSD